MKLPTTRDWGIGARLILIATVPACLMFAVVSVSLYVSGRAEIENTVRERGQLIAAALAETSHYGVVSGNTSYLERNVRRLLSTDPSVAAIEILDALRNVVVAAGAMPADPNVFEMPIGTEVPAINLFDTSPRPHVSLPSATLEPGQVVGHVRVAMSAAPILQDKLDRLLLSGLIVALAAILSGLAGLYMAQRLRSPLDAVTAMLREIRQGRFDVRFDKPAAGELGELQDAIVEMARGLSVTHQQLEERVASRTQELQAAVERASAADAEKRRLIAREDAAIEDERQRIAIEIHDHFNAALIVVRMRAQHVAALAAEPPDEDGIREIERTAQRIDETVNDLYSAARNIVQQLRPEVIDALGLKGAIEEMVRHYDELHPACNFRFSAAATFPDLRDRTAIMVYRLVQEALSNVVKHAQATSAIVQLEGRMQGGRVQIVIKDNGKGFDPGVRGHAGIGLIGMRERVATLDGSLTIGRNPEGGSTIEIELPIDR